MESGHWVEINGIKCVSLGHNITQTNNHNKILAHDYFGTDKVVRDMEDFSRATCLTPNIPKIIRVFDYEIIRDFKTDLVIGIRPKNN